MFNKIRIHILLRRVVSVWLILLFALFSGCAQDGGATDNEDINLYDGYTIIDSPETLDAVRYELDGKYLLACDIDLSAFGSWLPIGDDEHPFTGKFDGGGHVIRGLHVDLSDTTTCSVGLFGVVETGTIRSVGVVDGSVSVTVTSPEMLFSQAGGIAGVIRNDSLVDCCYFEGVISAAGHDQVFARASGIAAIAEASVISNCYSVAQITAAAEAANSMAAGVAAWLSRARIVNCYSAGDVSAQNDTSYAYIGGISASGTEDGVVEGSVVLLDTLDVHGFRHDASRVANYANVIDSAVWRDLKCSLFLGLNSDGRTISSRSAGRKRTYQKLGWDFDEVWRMDGSYPVLQVFSTPAG